MLLTHAILKSAVGIAVRKTLKQMRRRNGVQYPTYENQMAAATHRGEVYIHNGMTGRIHRMQAVDQLQTDWEPFMEKPKAVMRIREPKEPKPTKETV